jgi:hypothetical protein
MSSTRASTRNWPPRTSGNGARLANSSAFPQRRTAIAGAGTGGHQRSEVVTLLQPPPSVRLARYFCAPRPLYTSSARGGRVFYRGGGHEYRHLPNPSRCRPRLKPRPSVSAAAPQPTSERAAKNTSRRGRWCVMNKASCRRVAAECYRSVAERGRAPPRHSLFKAWRRISRSCGDVQH